MDKKNTILLTVIAVATLLVAVVGASFAFFAVQETNNANVNIETTTAKGSDVFNATNTGNLSLTVNNDNMLEKTEAYGKYVSDTDNTLKVSLKAGSGIATCSYELVWQDNGQVVSVDGKSVDNKYTKTAEAGTELEYTLQGKTGDAETDLKFTETNLDTTAKEVEDEQGTKTIYTKSLGTYSISNKAADNAETVQTWNLEARFYNLSVNQGIQMGKTLTGSVTVQNVQCSNEAVAAN